MQTIKRWASASQGEESDIPNVKEAGSVLHLEECFLCWFQITYEKELEGKDRSCCHAHLMTQLMRQNIKRRNKRNSQSFLASNVLFILLESTQSLPSTVPEKVSSNSQRLTQSRIVGRDFAAENVKGLKSHFDFLSIPYLIPFEAFQSKQINLQDLLWAQFPSIL